MNTTDHTSLKLGAAVIAATMIAALGVLYAFHLHVDQAQWGVVLGAVVAACELISARSVRRVWALVVLSAVLMALWAVYTVVLPPTASFLVAIAWSAPFLAVGSLVLRGIKAWAVVPRQDLRPIPWRVPTLGEGLLLGTMVLALCAPVFGSALHLPLNITGILLGSLFTWAAIGGVRRFHRLEWLPFVALAQMFVGSIAGGHPILIALLLAFPCVIAFLVLNVVISKFVVGSDQDPSP